MTDQKHIVTSPGVEIETDGMHPLVQAAMSGGELDTDKLRDLMALQERYEKNQAKMEYTRSMVALKKDLPAVIKKNKGVSYGKGKTSYTYATLDHAMEEVVPHLNNHGFSISWTPSIKDGMVYVTCHLTHIDGCEKESTMCAPPDTSGSKNPIQAIGSTQSYLERYTGLAVLGIATSDMPDADQPQTGQDDVDSKKNTEALGYMQSVGISRQKAEEYVQRGVQDWTTDDLAKLRELTKQIKQAKHPEHTTHEPPTLTKDQQLVYDTAVSVHGEDRAMVKLTAHFREFGTTLTNADHEQCNKLIRILSADADEIAAMESE